MILRIDFESQLEVLKMEILLKNMKNFSSEKP